MKILLLIATLFFCGILFASGFFPEPIVTNDPDGDLDPEVFYKIACEVYNDRLYHGAPVENVIGGISIRNGEYTYHYYLQDVLDMCGTLENI